jgi:hypothetical protein
MILEPRSQPGLGQGKREHVARKTQSSKRSCSIFTSGCGSANGAFTRPHELNPKIIQRLPACHARLLHSQRLVWDARGDPLPLSFADNDRNKRKAMQVLQQSKMARQPQYAKTRKAAFLNNYYETAALPRQSAGPPRPRAASLQTTP